MSIQGIAPAFSTVPFDPTTLFQAVEEGDKARVQYLLQIDQTNASGGALHQGFGQFQLTPLHAAIEQGHLEITQLLVDAGADVNAQTPDSITPLFRAAAGGHYQLVKYLLNHGAQITINTPCKTIQWTPLHTATEQGNLEMAQLLVDAGADVNVHASDEITPIFVAVEYNHLPLVDYLLQNKNLTTINQPNTLLGWTPLHMALYQCRLPLVQRLISSGADLTLKTRDDETPLYLAAGQGDPEVVKFLLKNGAASQINDSREEFGWMPLHIAVSEKHLDVVRCLLNSGANMMLQDKKGLTPFFIATTEKHTEIAQLLLERGADTAINDSCGTSQETPLFNAARSGNLKMFRLLTSHGAQITALSKIGASPLVLATTKGYSQIVQEILKHRESSNIINTPFSEKAWTPLQVAVIFNHPDIFHMLLKAGADLEATTTEGKTALLLAAQKGQKEIVKDLLKEGADLDSALTVAQQKQLQLDDDTQTVYDFLIQINQELQESLHKRRKLEE